MDSVSNERFLVVGLKQVSMRPDGRPRELCLKYKIPSYRIETSLTPPGHQNNPVAVANTRFLVIGLKHDEKYHKISTNKIQNTFRNIEITINVKTFYNF